MNNAAKVYGAIVLGLGAMGSASVYQLAKKGISVLGIDQFAPPHTMGSSGGETRITRKAIGEHSSYTPMSIRAYELFSDIENQTGKKLLTITGGLMITGRGAGIHRVPSFFNNTLEAARTYSIKHDVFDAGDIRKRFPQFNVADEEVAYYEHDAGFLCPETCIEAQLGLAEMHGADLHLNEKVVSISERGDLVLVTTEGGTYQAVSLICSAGAWIARFLPPDLAPLFKVYRQLLSWFDVHGCYSMFTPDKFPVFIWEIYDGFYGFPAVKGALGGLKVGTVDYSQPITPETLDRDVHDQERISVYENYVRQCFPAVGATCLKSQVCMYTTTPDAGFVVDRIGKNGSIIVCSACSGHGFKHSSAIGECMAELVIEGKSRLDISAFTANRLTANLPDPCKSEQEAGLPGSALPQS